MQAPKQIPEELKQYANFVPWKFVEKDGRMAKMPHTINQRWASVSNPKTWTTYDNAIKCTWADGIGFMFSNTPYVGVDIDHCLDGGEEEKKALSIAQDLGTYCEISPSGNGLHMIGKANLSRAYRTSKIEIYPDKRYFTLTGNTLQGFTEIKEIQRPLDEIVAGIAKETEKKQRAPQQHRQPMPTGGAEEIIQAIRKSRQAGLFFDLYDKGDTLRYGGNHSSADMALMNMLTYWTNGNPSLMLEIFNSSKLAQREGKDKKWEDREDYRQRTINAALAGWNGIGYKGKKQQREPRPVLMPTGERGKGLLQYALTDAGNAERMKELYFQNMRYVPDTKRWITWNGKQWEDGQDTESLQIYNLVIQMLRQAKREADEATQTALITEAAKVAAGKFFTKSEDTNKVRNCIKQAMGLFAISKGNLDQDPYILNCQNGTLDLRTGELRPHSREDMITKICRADFNPEAHSPLWEQTLQTILPDPEIRAWLKRFVGYALFGLTSEEKFAFMYGEGGGGKGTFMESIAHMLGDYAGTMDIDTILASRNDAGNGGQPTPQIAGLAGKRFIVASESGAGRSFNSAKLKNLTGGDKITARYLHSNPFTFTPQFTFFLSSNFMPTITDTTDNGIRRRLVIVPFEAKIEKRDIMLKTKLQTQEAMEGILTWCVEGAKEWWQNQGLGELPEAMKEKLRAYYEDNDELEDFLNECCERGQDLLAPVRYTHRCYIDWAKSNSNPMCEKSFKLQIERKGFKRVKKDGKNFFSGFKCLQIPV